MYCMCPQYSMSEFFSQPGTGPSVDAVGNWLDVDVAGNWADVGMSPGAVDWEELFFTAAAGLPAEVVFALGIAWNRIWEIWQNEFV